MKKKIVTLFLMHGMLLAMQTEGPDSDVYPVHRGHERAKQTPDYKNLLIKYFGFSPEEVSERTVIKPKVRRTSHVNLNFAVQARNVNEVTQILESAPIWHPATIQEALIVMNNPYIMCTSMTTPNLENSNRIRDLLVSKLPKVQ